MSKKPVAHHEIHYMLEHSELPRIAICKAIGVSRKAIYDWEYQLVRVRPHMIAKVAQASGIPLERIPAHVRDKAVKAFIDSYHTKTESKPSAKREQPPLPKLDYDAQVKADRAREERLLAKANDPKRYRVRNHGTPTKANRNPRTYSQFSNACTDIIVKGRDIPSDMEYPDLVAAALDKLGFYEAVYVAAHTIPYVTGSARATLPFTRRTYPAFYWQRPNGAQSMADTIDEAKARIKQQIAEDEAATADLI